MQCGAPNIHGDRVVCMLDEGHDSDEHRAFVEAETYEGDTVVIPLRWRGESPVISLPPIEDTRGRRKRAARYLAMHFERGLYRTVEELLVVHAAEWSSLPFRTGHYTNNALVYTSLEGFPKGLGRTVESRFNREGTLHDSELHDGLQDLGNQITHDVHDALFAFDDPDHYYPGAPLGSIDPVPDDHVRLVMAAMQRELDREPRTAQGLLGGGGYLPVPQLNELPWHTQVALAERRRYRFKQWGIGHAEWERNEWSIWNVPDDDYFPDFPKQSL